MPSLPLTGAGPSAATDPYGISFDGGDYVSCADDASQEIGANE